MNFTKGTSLTLNAVTTDSGHKLLSPGIIAIVGHIPSGTVPTPAEVTEFYGVKQEDKRFLTLSKAYKEDRLIFNYSAKDGGGPDPKNRELLGKYFGFIQWADKEAPGVSVSEPPVAVIDSKSTFDEQAAQEALGVKPLPKPTPLDAVAPVAEPAPAPANGHTDKTKTVTKVTTTTRTESDTPGTGTPDVEASIAQAITDSLHAGQEWVWPGGSLRIDAVDVPAKRVFAAYPYKHGHDIKWLKGDAIGMTVFVNCLITKKAEVAPVA